MIFSLSLHGFLANHRHRQTGQVNGNFKLALGVINFKSLELWNKKAWCLSCW